MYFALPRQTNGNFKCTFLENWTVTFFQTSTECGGGSALSENEKKIGGLRASFGARGRQSQNFDPPYLVRQVAHGHQILSGVRGDLA